MSPITPRGIELNLAAARPMEAIRVARSMLHGARTVTLATLDPGGYPYSTVTNLAVEPDGTPLIYTVFIALHARNLLADPRVSLTLADMESDVLTTPRLTLSGLAERVAEDGMEAAKTRYLARFPKAKLYLALPDAMLFRIRIQAVQLNGGPAQNANDVTPADLRTDLSQAAALMAEEKALLTALNTGDLPARIAAAAGAAAGRWKVCGLDPEGIDLAGPAGLARLWLDAPATTRTAFETALAKRLALPLAS